MGKQAPKGAGLATEADEASSGRNRADLRRGYGRIEGGHALASRRRRGDCAPAYRNGPQGDDTAERITPIEGQLQWPHVRASGDRALVLPPALGRGRLGKVPSGSADEVGKRPVGRGP